jgi:hypothetical protein
MEMPDPTSEWLKVHVPDEDLALVLRALLGDPPDLSRLQGLEEPSRAVGPLFEVLGIEHGGDGYGLAWAVCRSLPTDAAIRELVGFLLQPLPYERKIRDTFLACGLDGAYIAPYRADASFALALDVVANLFWFWEDPFLWFDVFERFEEAYEWRGGTSWLGDSARGLRRATARWKDTPLSHEAYRSQH